MNKPSQKQHQIADTSNWKTDSDFLIHFILIYQPSNSRPSILPVDTCSLYQEMLYIQCHLYFQIKSQQVVRNCKNPIAIRLKLRLKSKMHVKCLFQESKVTGSSNVSVEFVLLKLRSKAVIQFSNKT